jgi:hypothetical protein
MLRKLGAVLPTAGILAALFAAFLLASMGACEEEETCGEAEDKCCDKCPYGYDCTDVECDDTGDGCVPQCECTCTCYDYNYYYYESYEDPEEDSGSEA